MTCTAHRPGDDPTRAGYVVRTLCVDWGRSEPGTPIVEIRDATTADATGEVFPLPWHVVLLSPYGDGARALVGCTATMGMAEVAAMQVVAEITGDITLRPTLSLPTT